MSRLRSVTSTRGKPLDHALPVSAVITSCSPSTRAATAAAPSRLARIRSNDEGFPPRCTWPSRVTRGSSPEVLVGAVVGHLLYPQPGSLGHHDEGVVLAPGVGLAHRGRHVFQRGLPLRDDRHLGTAGDAAEQRQVAAVAAHGLHQEHPLVRLGGVPEPVDGVDDRVEGGVDPDRHRRAPQVVVDRGRDADGGHPFLVEEVGGPAASRRHRSPPGRRCPRLPGCGGPWRALLGVHLRAPGGAEDGPAPMVDVARRRAAPAGGACP